MGEFIVDADVMARTRFGTSQLTETLSGLLILLSRDVRPWHRDWHDAHVAALGARLADDPVGAALVRHAFGATWTADFLTVPPSAPDFDLDEELQYLESLDLSVLPYRFGTHSGWLEACYDLGTAVLAPTCGYFAQQRPCLTYRHDEQGLDVASLQAAVRTAYEQRPQWQAKLEDRRQEREELAFHVRPPIGRRICRAWRARCCRGSCCGSWCSRAR